MNGLITDPELLFRDHCRLEVVMEGRGKWRVYDGIEEKGIEVKATTPRGAIAQYERIVGYDMEVSGGKAPFYLKKIRRVR